MTKFIGRKNHECYGSPSRRPKLAERARHYGWELEPLTSQSISDSAPILVHYHVKVAETGETVFAMSASEVSQFLAEGEEQEVKRLLEVMQDGWVLRELYYPLGTREGFVVLTADNEIVTHGSYAEVYAELQHLRGDD